MKLALILSTLLLCISGCYQVSSNGDEDFRTVPVTNNPHLTPQRAPGSQTAMPY